MRCSTCGTDNEPDSRFCGQCGAPVGSGPPSTNNAFTTKPGPGRVAPTQKIPPGGAPAQHSGLATGVRNHPPSMPPPIGAPPAPAPISAQAAVIPRTSSRPPTIQAPPATAARPPAPLPTASIARPADPSIGTSVPRRGRNWPLIVILFIIDLGLAGSGAFMLQRGLIRDDELPAVKAETGK